MNIRSFVRALSFFIAFYAAAQEERIEKFLCDIIVHEDSTVTVTETITVRALGHNIKRGIIRELPTKYKDAWGNQKIIDLRVIKALRDGQPVLYFIKDAVNGKRIFLGSAHIILQPDRYTYTISYQVNRVIGFFEEYDELYWNVTGNGWRFPIDFVKVTIALPAVIPTAEIKAEAYTGFFGVKGRDYQVSLKPNNRVEFTSMRSFAPHEGLTAVVAWPKEYVMPLPVTATIYYLLRDNFGTFWVWLGVLIMLILYGFMLIRWRMQQRLSTIIPLFYPPTGFSPGAVRYVDRIGYDGTALASDIMNMAVHGLVTLEYKKHFLSHEYIVRKVSEPVAASRELDALYGGLDAMLFKASNAVTISQSYNPVLAGFSDQLRARYQTQYANFFLSRAEFSFWALLASGVFIIPAMLSGAVLAVIGSVVLIVLFLLTWLIRGYTPAGKRVKEHIEGFKLYLKTAESERMAIVGSPPTKTPELYERYLPYAVALGCERQWTAQFASLFASLARQGIVYHPQWFIGGPARFEPDTFVSNLVRDVGYAYSQPISASGSAPGSSSGFGGRGSSGGGAGGGGGGGW